MIAVEHVSKYFNNIKAVDDISFNITEGENLIILGTSGCGKTTTLRMLNRLIEPSQGQISVNGINIHAQSPQQLRLGIGYVLQQNGLFPHYTVSENIAVVPKLLGWNKERIISRVKELMEKLHLNYESYADCYPNQLSGGQQQRVNVARALAADPPLLLMDEPFGALDTITRSRIIMDFSRLDEFKRKTILMVTHDVQEAFELADKICLMDNGRIMQIGSPSELLFQPANDFVKAFLSDQYLPLALKIVRLKNVWALLTAGHNNSTINNIIDHNETFWDVLQKLAKNNHTSDTLLVKNDRDEIREVKTEALMHVFNQYQYH